MFLHGKKKQTKENNTPQSENTGICVCYIHLHALIFDTEYYGRTKASIVQSPENNVSDLK